MESGGDKSEGALPNPQSEFKVPGSVGPIGPRRFVKLKEVEGAGANNQEIRNEKTFNDSAVKNSAELSRADAVDETNTTVATTSKTSDPSLEDKKRSQVAAGAGRPGKPTELKLNYQEPPGAMPFDSRYSLEVLKTGSIADRVKFSKDKTFFVVGRTPLCDIVAENPTVSRVHAIFQFVGGTPSSAADANSNDEKNGMFECKERGLYLYDLNSTHGTFLNKNQVYPNRYYRLRVGHMVKFGNSTRQYIVDGPSEDQEEESDKTVTELLQERLQKEFIRKKITQAATIEEEEEKVEDTGIDWGMGEDAVEDTDYSVNPFAVDFESSDLSLDNPKKTLAGWFEREGYDSLFYDVREKASGHFICRVNLPLDGPNGAPVFAEVDVKGKKKEAIVQCALRACQILDSYGVLRQSHHEGYKKKMKDWEEQDYYSSDEDTFLDRTGSIESKRKRRMKQSGKDVEVAESFESLNAKNDQIEKEIQDIEEKIKKAEIKKEQEDNEVDPLEAFMQTVKSGALEVKQLKSKLKQLKEEQQRVKKLIEKARPVSLPKSLITRAETEKPDISDIKKEKVELPKSSAVSAAKFTPVKTATAPKTISENESEGEKNAKEEKREGSGNASNEKKEANDEPSVKKEVEVKLSLKRMPPKFLQVSSALPVLDDDDDAEPTTRDPKDDQEDEESSTSAPSKKKRKRNRAQLRKEDKFQYDADNPDEYSVWVPPTDQAGDGKIKLNEKLGY